MAPAILVVGAGPAGLAAALELARRGLPPRLVDAEGGPSPVRESRALGVLPRTLAILGPAGVGDRLRDAANPVRRIEIRAGGRTVAADFAESGDADAAIHVLPQGRTERLLLDALADRGIVPEWNTRLAVLAGRRVVLEHAGRTETADFDRILGCDGARSAVRDLAGIPFAGRAIETEFGLADIALAEDRDPGTLRFALLAQGGAIGRIPIDARTVRYIATFPDALARIPPDEPAAATLWTSRFRIAFRMVSTFAKGPVLLAGDAAHVHSPVGARGMNLGIEDAAWAAWAIAEGREDAYSAARLPVARRTLRETRLQTGAVVGSTALIRLARSRLAPVALGVPTIRRRAIARLLGLDRPLPPWL